MTNTYQACRNYGHDWRFTGYAKETCTRCASMRQNEDGNYTYTYPPEYIKETAVPDKLMGTCPVCNGTTRVPVPEKSQQYIKHNARWGHWGVGGYQPAGPGPFVDGQGYEGGTLPCGNCGGQYMFGKPTGQVALRADGSPCEHSYKDSDESDHTRGWHVSYCEHCKDRCVIDSSD